MYFNADQARQQLAEVDHGHPGLMLPFLLGFITSWCLRHRQGAWAMR
jgi:hypothetical protein